MATLAIFDSTLSTRTRVKALFSSLAINMLLPFVNGVMLGFGEIFAKNVIIGWLGWKVPGSDSVATTTGIGVRTPWGQRHKPKQS
jgi:Outer membrane protein TOM13